MPDNQIKTKKDVFNSIAEATIFGNLGLFIGAGLSMAVMEKGKNAVALSWPKLIERCCDKLDLNFKAIPKDGASYPQIASAVCKAYVEKNGGTYPEAVSILKKEIARTTCWYPEPEVRMEYAKYFKSLDPAWVITTNYDTIIESILTGKGYSLGPEDYMVAQKGLIPVYHLHGIRNNPDSIIITQEDYVTLFRPNQYRQQKLPLTIRESVTVLIGYNLGDFNVLSAVDWSRNVFTDRNAGYPHDLIQFLYCKSPKLKPYRDHNGALILEFDDLSVLLDELKVVIDQKVKRHKSSVKTSKELNQIMISPLPSDIDSFLKDSEFRKDLLDQLNDVFLVNAFLEFFNQVIDITWEQAKENGAFHIYKNQLEMLTDILINVDIKTMPPALVEGVASTLEDVAYFIGDTLGKSRAANQHWKDVSPTIPKNTLVELEDIAQSRDYQNLLKLLNVKRKYFGSELGL